MPQLCIHNHRNPLCKHTWKVVKMFFSCLFCGKVFQARTSWKEDISHLIHNYVIHQLLKFPYDGYHFTGVWKDVSCSFGERHLAHREERFASVQAGSAQWAVRRPVSRPFQLEWLHGSSPPPLLKMLQYLEVAALSVIPSLRGEARVLGDNAISFPMARCHSASSKSWDKLHCSNIV